MICVHHMRVNHNPIYMNYVTRGWEKVASRTGNTRKTAGQNSRCPSTTTHTQRKGRPTTESPEKRAKGRDRERQAAHRKARQKHQDVRGKAPRSPNRQSFNAYYHYHPLGMSLIAV
ncbi:hypothetical protein BC832DRAFT_476821 [Gaertneriomyces semiglobifer]|nr:hypothetical protein BC832DRAFT_476821 [Gaertneriomyces semiglobifer]